MDQATNPEGRKTEPEGLRIQTQTAETGDGVLDGRGSQPPPLARGMGSAVGGLNFGTF